MLYLNGSAYTHVDQPFHGNLRRCAWGRGLETQTRSQISLESAIRKRGTITNQFVRVSGRKSRHLRLRRKLFERRVYHCNLLIGEDLSGEVDAAIFYFVCLYTYMCFLFS